MDRIGGINVCYFELSDIRKALISNPKLPHNKKFVELFVGFLVARMLDEEVGVHLKVGFPLKATRRQKAPIVGPSLQELVTRPELVEDSDVDICIGNESSLILCQITRIVPRRGANRVVDDLFGVLKKKFKVQSDDNLTLIVNIEEQVEFSGEELCNFLSREQVPFGAVYVVGMSGIMSKRFKCWRIHPDLMESSEFEIGPLS